MICPPRAVGKTHGLAARARRIADRLPAELFTHLRSAPLDARVVRILVNTGASSIEAGVVSTNAHSREVLEEQFAIKPVANRPCRIALGPLERLRCGMHMPRPAPILRVRDDGPNFHERRVTRWPEDLQSRSVRGRVQTSVRG